MNDPDRIITVTNTKPAIEEILLCLVMEMEREHMTFKEIVSMLKRLVFKVYLREHRSQQKACTALDVSRGNFGGWSKL